MFSIVPELSKQYLKELCKSERMKNNDCYGTPELNDKLYLHYKGFRKIQALEEYTALKCLWLEGNGLDELGGLERQTQLRTLYLHENCIHEIKGLETLTDLNTLNLCKNFVSRITGLEKCQNLQTLLIAHNHLQSKQDIEHVLSLPSLVTLDLQHNRLDDGPGVLEVISAMPDLRVLYLMGNPCVKGIRYYRKTVIAQCKELRYLDDRPVFEDERRRVKAWKANYDTTGDYEKANEAEREELKVMRAEKAELEQANFRAFDAMVKEGLNSRAEREAAVEATQAAYAQQRLEEDGEEEEVKRGELLAGNGVLKDDDYVRSGDKKQQQKGYHGKLTNDGEPVLVLKPETPSLKASRLANRAKIMGKEPQTSGSSDNASAGGFFAAGATPEGNISGSGGAANANAAVVRDEGERTAAHQAACEGYKSLVSEDIWDDEEVAVVAPNFQRGLEDLLGALQNHALPPPPPGPGGGSSESGGSGGSGAVSDAASPARIDEVLAAAKNFADASNVAVAAPMPSPPPLLSKPHISEAAPLSTGELVPLPPPPPPMSGVALLPSPTDFNELD